MEHFQPPLAHQLEPAARTPKAPLWMKTYSYHSHQPEIKTRNISENIPIGDCQGN